jgi:hypothetical protein
MRLFVSLFAYAFGKQHWPNVDAAAAREIALGESSSVPGFRTLYRLRKLVDEIELHTDHSTLIARARDRAAGRFLRSTCDQWIAIDDDVDADDKACMAMLTTQTENILSAAMRMRTGARDFNVAFNGAREIPIGVPFRVSRVGMGMIRIPRAELVAVAGCFLENQWDEPNPDAEKYNAATRELYTAGRPLDAALRGVVVGVDTSPGVFLPVVKDRKWLDDDWAFCARAEDALIDVWSIILPGIAHAGIPNLEATR